MRTAVGTGLLFGLLFAEAFYQRHLHRKREFLTSLETLRASLSELSLAFTSYTQVTNEAAAAARTLSRTIRRGGKP